MLSVGTELSKMMFRLTAKSFVKSSLISTFGMYVYDRVNE